jgi:hypothetical protein
MWFIVVLLTQAMSRDIRGDDHEAFLVPDRFGTAVVERDSGRLLAG